MPHDHAINDYRKFTGTTVNRVGRPPRELPRSSNGSVAKSAVVEPDFDLVETSFIVIVQNCSDSIMHLHIGNALFPEVLADGRNGFLLEYLIEDDVEVGKLLPSFGGADAT